LTRRITAARNAPVPRSAVFWTPARPPPYDADNMVIVIGNVLAGLLAVSLFTATVRLSK
jgi:hypothetical protein